MSTFKPLELDSDLVDELWRSPIAQAVERVASRQTHPVTHAAFEEVPWHLFGIPQAGRSQITVRTPFLDNDIVALAYRAPAQLRRSSRTALRLIRQNSPSLSGVPTDRGLAWPGPTWHSSARRVASSVTFKLDYWHKEGLPSALSMTEPWFSALDALGLLGLHKFLPYRRWFRHECAAYVADVVADVRKRHMPFWNSQFLATLADDHVRGRHNRLRELNAVLTLEAVDRLLIGNTTPTGTSHGLA
jgi:asparagine synthase (glutamine-hydrolysing)